MISSLTRSIEYCVLYIILWHCWLVVLFVLVRFCCCCFFFVFLRRVETERKSPNKRWIHQLRYVLIRSRFSHRHPAKGTGMEQRVSGGIFSWWFILKGPAWGRMAKLSGCKSGSGQSLGRLDQTENKGNAGLQFQRKKNRWSIKEFRCRRSDKHPGIEVETKYIIYNADRGRGQRWRASWGHSVHWWRFQDLSVATGMEGGMQEMGTREAISVMTLLHFSSCRISGSVVTILYYKHSWLNHMLVYCTFHLPSVFSVVR